jgi:hypothetical protein
MNTLDIPEPVNIDGKPDGFYLICKADDETEWCLVYLYSHEDFDCRHIAFSPIDGGVLMPIWDLTEDSILIPAHITCAPHETATRISDLGAIAIAALQGQQNAS